MPYPANVRWSDSFPGLPDGIFASSALGAAYVDTGVNNFGAQAFAEIDDNGEGGLRVTAKRSLRVGELGNSLDLRFRVMGVSAATSTLSTNGRLTVVAATTANLGDVKDAIDATTGTPFTTAYYGGASANDALNAGTRIFAFEGGTGDGYARFEILPKDDVRAILGKTKPADAAANYLFLPAKVPFRGTIDIAHTLYLKADAGTSKTATARWWDEEA